jgi:hypothetical protein
MTNQNFGRLAPVSATVAVLFTGCTQPDPGTAAGRSDIAGQQCTLCIAENPGDYDACHAVCVRRVEDESTYLKAIGR